MFRSNVITKKGALERPTEDLTDCEQAQDHPIIPPASDKTNDISFSTALEKRTKLFRSGRRRYQPSMQTFTGTIQRKELLKVTGLQQSKKNPFPA
jgi:hypothetical protein